MSSDLRTAIYGRRRAYLERLEHRLKECVEWDPNMKWVPELNLKAETYHCLNLFPELTPKDRSPNPNNAQNGEYANSPSGAWRYTINVLPRGTELTTWYASRIGTVVFDGPVNVPTLYGSRKWGDKFCFNHNPWMSLTPAEVFSMRGGIRKAKGHTIVAGLGLGHLLIEVSKKKTVKKVTLIEISQELVDWLLPRIKPHLGQEVDVVVGDARKVIPSMEADAALVDIDSTYGNNSFRQPHQHIKSFWVWGSSPISTSE